MCFDASWADSDESANSAWETQYIQFTRVLILLLAYARIRSSLYWFPLGHAHNCKHFSICRPSAVIYSTRNIYHLLLRLTIFDLWEKLFRVESLDTSISFCLSNEGIDDWVRLFIVVRRRRRMPEIVNMPRIMSAHNCYKFVCCLFSVFLRGQSCCYAISRGQIINEFAPTFPITSTERPFVSRSRPNRLLSAEFGWRTN